MNFDEIRKLGAILDGTYKDTDNNGSFKIISKLNGDSMMTITCMVVVNLLNRAEMKVEAKKAEDQLAKACNAKLKDIKSEFKLECGRALKTKQAGMIPSVELINMNVYSPKGLALVRNLFNFEVS
tara:strand:- start:687 stop:1061 length:375 start_codon:yes stop_codon:yes gene_type:complete